MAQAPCAILSTEDPTMQVTIDIPKEHEERIQEKAAQQGVPPAELLRDVVIGFLDQEDDFDAAASYVLSKNAELYDRLS